MIQLPDTINSLPAVQVSQLLNEQFAAHSTIVVTAPPGSGKSTCLPLTVLKGYVEALRCECPQRILMLEPRRLAARQIASRMAQLIGEEVGQTIGYRVRFQTCVSAQTRIEVITEGILTRMLIEDSLLSDVAVVIFDEFHERSLQSDVALALTRQAQQLVRPDLRLLIMSATLDAAPLCEALQAVSLSAEGRLFPVDVRYADLEVVPAVRQALARHEGDILVFLPGEAEIRHCQQVLEASSWPEPLEVLPLYGMLPQQQQQRVFALSDKRRVILATPVAETSLTLPGIRVVIDSGLCRRMEFSPSTGLSRLQTVQISLDMAQQRAGRAGRLSAGICYRLWNAAVQHRMEPSRVPEILTADLAPMVLDIAAWGESQPGQLPWLTPPPPAAILQAQRLLRSLGAIEPDGRITTHGRRLSQLPCHPRIAQMLVKATDDAHRALACALAALLDERDPLASTCPSADLLLRLDLFASSRSLPASLSHSFAAYCRLSHVAPNVSFASVLDDAALLLAYAYPERIALQQPDGSYRLTTGDAARLDADDPLSASEWLVVANVNTQKGGVGRIFLALAAHSEQLATFAQSRTTLQWDARLGRVAARRDLAIGALILRSEAITNLSREQRLAAIAKAALKEGATMFDLASDEVVHLQQRIATLASWHPELQLPDVSTTGLLERVGEWLPLFAPDAQSVNDLRRISIREVLWSQLSYDQQLLADRLVPTHVKMPTGNRIRIEYRPGAELPVLRVRLQECFGMADTPRIDDGRHPLLLELLSPGFKPVQLTQDLRSFWSNLYYEVRAELKRRYPKHAWPDNPLEQNKTAARK